MRSRGILLHRSFAAVIAVGSLLSSATLVSAGSVGSQKQKVDQIAEQLDDLENRIGQLDEDYGAAQDRKAVLDQDIADSQARIAQQQARLGELAGTLGDIAVDKYVTGSALELSPLFSNAAAYSEAEQKDSFSRLALDNGSGSTDEMLALSEDLAKEQALARPQAAAGRRPRRHAGLQARRSPDAADRIPAEAVVGAGRPRRCNRAGARAPRRGRRGCRDRQAAASCR